MATTHIGCPYCVASRGLKGSEVADLPTNYEEFAQHVEREHHIPVRRKHETLEAALARFRREQPEAGGEKCRCPRCQAVRAFGEPAPSHVYVDERGWPLLRDHGKRS